VLRGLQEVVRLYLSW